jgi:hypothetical protein
MELLYPIARAFVWYYLLFAVSFALGRVRGWWRAVLAAAVSTALHIWVLPLVP